MASDFPATILHWAHASCPRLLLFTPHAAGRNAGIRCRLRPEVARGYPGCLGSDHRPIRLPRYRWFSRVWKTSGGIMRRVVISILMLVAVKAPAMAKDKPFQVVSWPESGQPVLRFTFSRFNGVGPSIGKEHTYVSDVAAENLSDKTITGASFSLYLFDKTNARIGEGSINLTDVSAGQIVKFQVTIEASGYPSSVTVATSAPRTISITVNSVPQGAALAQWTERRWESRRRSWMLELGSTYFSLRRRDSIPGSSHLKFLRVTRLGAASAMNWGAQRMTPSNSGTDPS